ncbi:hypothetical protein Zmor_005526 [Zophobas morio]|uniref:Uncharacterized protein n=1 Tax=Zophobas morio TaxID=2755281 RepID=A0AA38IQ10_9CUCU|nr:hypothetical protein Zmor_005526 [Zophobas morio]
MVGGAGAAPPGTRDDVTGRWFIVRTIIRRNGEGDVNGKRAGGNPCRIGHIACQEVRNFYARRGCGDQSAFRVETYWVLGAGKRWYTGQVENCSNYFFYTRSNSDEGRYFLAGTCFEGMTFGDGRK